MADAARLDASLTRRCRQLGTTSLSIHDAQKDGPVRDRAKLHQALRELEDLERLRLVHEGKRKTILLNPALVAK
jgi:hypothetical protein